MWWVIYFLINLLLPGNRSTSTEDAFENGDDYEVNSDEVDKRFTDNIFSFIIIKFRQHIQVAHIHYKKKKHI